MFGIVGYVSLRHGWSIDVEPVRAMTSPVGAGKSCSRSGLAALGNRRLRREAQRHRFTTASNTEVIAHLYEQRRVECVCDLHGMFAVIIWDERRG